MSEDPTQDMSQKYDTKPTIETVLERINALSTELHSELRVVREEMRKRFDALDIRLDRIEGAVHETKSNFHMLRADFNELRGQLREHFPASK